MYVNTRNARAIAEAALQNLNPRRAVTWSGFTAGYVGLRGLTEIGRRIDDVAYPEWRDQPVVQPVFIFANGRSGTTMLHRLMGLDEETFAGFKLYQSIFSAVSLQRAFEGISNGPLGGLARKGVDTINETFFRDTVWDGIHAMGIDVEEEDETTFVYGFESPTISLLNPFMRDYTRLTWLDAHDDERRRRFMDFYEATVKKHLFAVGGNRRFLNKNVFFAPRVRSMLERFPDARFVYLVRHPFDALPSFMSMFYEKWKTHSPELNRASPEAIEMMNMGYSYYRAAAELSRELPAKNFRVVRYDSLIQSPKQLVEELYAWMGLDMSKAYLSRLEAATSRQRKYRSSHRYSLEQFGITRDEVRRELDGVFEAFELDPFRD
ncbi:MAG: sulfotransferase [Myxococcota bacterium]